MAQPTDGPKPVLRYANPGVLFAGRFTYRTWGSVWGVVGALAFAALSLSSLPPANMPVMLRVAIGVGLVAVAGYGAFLIAAGRFYDVRITEDGIEKGRRFRPWADIRSIGGCRQGHGGRIILEVFVGRELISWDMALPTTPPLTDEEFDRLIRMLDLYLSDAFPHVKVEPTPRVSD